MSPSAKADPARLPAWLTGAPYAHRGLHGPDRLENSRAAFEAAMEAGFGIELDVQPSRDDEVLVFHDYGLDRLTGEQGRVADLSLTELQRIKLNGFDETIPSLPQVLGLVAGRAPLLIELKSKRRNAAALCRSVLRALDGYAGDAGVMSFNPEVGAWFARHGPHVTRGLVISEEASGRLERRLACWRARPDFLAYDIRDLPSRFATGARKKGVPVLTWTVRTSRQADIAAVHADQIIHELAQ